MVPKKKKLKESKKRKTGAEWLKEQGLKGTIVGMSPEQLALIDAAAALEGQSRAFFTAKHAAAAAKAILEAAGKLP